MRLFAIIFLSLILMMIPASAEEYIEVACYENVTDSGNNWGGSGITTREFLTYNHQYRIRQEGTATNASIYFSSLTNLEEFYITIWRANGTNFDRVGITENLLSQLSAPSICNLTFTSPIANVQEGDFVGYRLVWSESGATTCMKVVTESTTSTYLTTDEIADAVNFNWTSKTSGTSAVPIKIYMQSPTLVTIGDSIMSGRPLHCSFIEESDVTQYNSSISYQLNALNGWVYQNMGYSSQKTDQIDARFTNDVVNLHPNFVIINGGINDIVAGYSNETILSNWDSILTKADNAGIQVIVIPITPWTSGTADQNRKADYINAELMKLSNNHTSIFVDVRDDIGWYRAGGDPGTYWNLNPVYDADGVHLTVAGYAKVAEVIYESIGTNYTSGVCNFFGVNITNLPELYTFVNNESLISNDYTNNTFTMYVPFYQNDSNHSFSINDTTLYLESNNDGSPSYYRFAGNTEYSNASIFGFDTIARSFADYADTTRAYIYSDSGATGNILDCNISYLGYNSANKYGLCLNGYDNNTITDSTFMYNRYGMWLKYSDYNNMSNISTNSPASYSLYMEYSDNNILEHSEVSTAGAGLALYLSTSADNNEFKYTNFTADTGVAVYISSANSNSFDNINATSSSNHGTRLVTTTGIIFNNSTVQSGSSNDIQIRTSTGAFIKDQLDTSYTVDIYDETSELTIENTDGHLFNETATATAYSYQNGTFQMYETGTAEPFTVTQYDSFLDSTTANSTVLGVPHATSSINITSGTIDSWISSGLTPSAYYELLTGGTTIDFIYADVDGNVTVTDDLAVGEYYLTPAVTYNVSGYVFDDDTPANPIEGATVNRAGVQSTTTNATGYYILAVYNSTSTFTANANGYNYNQTDITVDGAPLTDQNFTLTAEQPNYVPLPLYLLTSIVTLGGLFLTIPRRDDYGDEDVTLRNVIAGIISGGLAVTLSKVSINGQLVQTYAGVASTDVVVTGNSTIQIAYLGWFWIMIAIVAFMMTFYCVLKIVQYYADSELDMDFGDEYI